jgi:hypothetical protein
VSVVIVGTANATALAGCINAPCMCTCKINDVGKNETNRESE